MDAIYARLAWLPEPPADFRQQCAALRRSVGGAGGEAIRLAAHALNEGQLNQLGKALGELQASAADLSPLAPFRLGILGNGTLDLLKRPLVASAARFGLALECLLSDYDQILHPAMDPDSDLHRGKPDAILLALDYRGLPWRFGGGDAESEAAEVAGAWSFIQTVIGAIRANGKAPCIVQTIAAPPEAIFGSFDRAATGSRRRMIDALNRQIVEALRGTEDIIFDVAGLAETVGLANWHDPAQWNMAKLPFSNEMAPLYADHVGRIAGAIRGKSRRCLVLDLDNTLWGGVIGDDGLEGIALAQGDATGEAFLAVQQLAIDLRERGIVLAVCSKNDDDVARGGFGHPDMLLKLDQIAVFQANWKDKASNIKAIAEELSLGIDSMVFLDDNPAERGIVRQMLPQVAVPELPEDPALYARTLAAAGYFEAITFSAEDRTRADFYQDNARRIALRGEAGDVNAYLASLDMTITLQPFDLTGRGRITQLINKSNQFNLTTRRYTEPEVAAAEAECFTLQIRLADRFGDNGMISVVIARPTDPGIWEIDTWLMSCRVLGRGVETMVLHELIAQGAARGIRSIVGVYRPTDRNTMVRDHYARLGFTPIATEADGTTRWMLDIAAGSALAAIPMTVQRTGFYTGSGALTL